MSLIDIKAMAAEAKSSGYSSMEIDGRYLLACILNMNKTEENTGDVLFYKVDRTKLDHFLQNMKIKKV